jgi:hypothetical protein
VHEVVRQSGAATGAAHREDDAGVALDEGLRGPAVGHAGERESHGSSVRRGSTDLTAS